VSENTAFRFFLCISGGERGRGRETRCCKYRVLMNARGVNRNILEDIHDSNKGSNLISSAGNKLVSHCNKSGAYVILIFISTY